MAAVAFVRAVVLLLLVATADSQKSFGFGGAESSSSGAPLGAAEALAKRLQCPRARELDVPMPCPNKTRHPVFHMHIAKTGGRSVYQVGAKLVGLPPCRWNPHYHSWGASDQFIRDAAAHREDMAREPCFATYEVGWRAVDYGFGPDVPPIVLTMLREPHSWVVSAIEHDRLEKGRNQGIDDIVRRGCLFDWLIKREKRPEGCVGYDYLSFVPAKFLSWPKSGPYLSMSEEDIAAASHGWKEWTPGRGDGGGPPGIVATAKAHLDACVFGFVEYFTASRCLWSFQFGIPFTREECDCRHREMKMRSDVADVATSPEGYHRRAAAGVDSGNLTAAWARRSLRLHRDSAGEVHTGTRKSSQEEVSLQSIDALHKVSNSPFGVIYAYGLNLFFRRIQIVEEATGVKLICGLDR